MLAVFGIESKGTKIKVAMLVSIRNSTTIQPPGSP